MFLLNAQRELELVKQGSADPFIALELSLGFHIIQLTETDIGSLKSKRFAISRVSILLIILSAVKNWKVHHTIRKPLDIAVILAEIQIRDAIAAIEKGNLDAALVLLCSARNELIQKSCIELT